MSHPVLFLAAGFGTRMAPLTQDRPKPLIEVGGVTLIDHAVDLARRADCAPLVANAHYKAEMLVDHFGQSDVQVTVESPEILDSGGAVKAALPLLSGDPVFTMNTDAIWSGLNPFETLAMAWRPEMEVLALLVPRDHAHGYKGDGNFICDQAGLIRPGDGAIYTGLQLVRTGAFRDHPDAVFGMWDIWNRAISRKTAFGLSYSGHWCDVGRPECIQIAENLLERSHV